MSATPDVRWFQRAGDPLRLRPTCVGEDDLLIEAFATSELYVEVTVSPLVSPHPTPADETARWDTAEVIEAALALVGEAWDDGNATGLDGYIGPGRGAGEIDREAQHARTRMVHKADRLLSEHATPSPVADKED